MSDSAPRISIFLLLACPVLLAHFYSASDSYGVLASSLASVGLSVYVLTEGLAGIASARLRGVLALALFTPLAAYVFAQLVSFYFQGVHLNQQFFYHFDLPTLRVALMIYYPILIVFVLWLGVICFVIWRSRHQHSVRNTSALVLGPMLLLALALDPGIRRASAITVSALVNSRPLNLELIDWEGLALNRAAIGQETLEASAGKNLVVVFLEGLEAVYTDDALFPGLTPNLNALADQGLPFSSVEQVPGSGWTIGGIVASFCGTPLLYESRIGGNNIMQNRLLDEVVCLPDVLHAAGYYQVFMGGADIEFASKGSFLTQHSYDEALGRDELRPLLDDENYLGDWGLFDDSLFEIAVEEFASLAERGQPFNLTLLTVDTHHPFGNPSASCRPYQRQDNSILHAVHCTDQLVGDFIDRISAHPGWEDTVVVLLSDHLAMQNAAFELFPEDYDRQLLVTVLNGGHDPAETRAATPMDLAPTLLDLIQVEHDAQFLAGRSLMNTAPDNAGIGRQSVTRYLTIRQLNSRYLSSNDRGELLYSLESVNYEDLGRINQITDVELAGDTLNFTATGQDPHFFLPLQGHDENWVKVFITLDVEQSTRFSLYYQSDTQGGFSEERKMTTNLQPGTNDLLFFLEDRAISGSLRLDPGQLSGHYEIANLEVRTRLSEAESGD